MKYLKKAKLAFALTAAFGAVALTSQTQAVTLSQDGLGEVAIAPYYTANDGWLTLINLTNTSDKPIVVKVRVHEGKNSRDVYDINVAMSAHDVYTAKIGMDANGNPSMTSTDADTCLIGASYNVAGPFSSLGYSGLDDRSQSSADSMEVAGAVSDMERLGEGYIEFINMGYTEVAPALVDPAAGFNNGSANPNNRTVGHHIENHNCTAVSKAFTIAEMNGTGDQLKSTQSQFGEPTNVLKFNFRLLNPSRGIETGNSATTWSSFYNAGPFGTPDATITPLVNAACTVGRGDERSVAAVPDLATTAGPEWDPAGTGGSCMNLITAQEPYAFLEPSLNDAYPAQGTFIDDTRNAGVVSTPGAQDPERATPAGTLPTNTDGRGVDALSYTIQRSSAINEWALESSLGTKTDWVVTFPTKGFYVDSGTGRQAARIPGDRDEAFYAADTWYARANSGAGARSLGNTETYPPFANRFGSAGSCNEVSFSAFDRAENDEQQVGGVIPSPAPATARTSLCYEANVLTFNGASSLLGSNNSRDVPLPTLTGNGAQAGWMELNLDVDASAQAPVANTGVVDNGLMGYSGLPTIGFMIKQRTFAGDVTKNYASSVDHSYKRKYSY